MTRRGRISSPTARGGRISLQSFQDRLDGRRTSPRGGCDVVPAQQEIGEHLGRDRQALAPAHGDGDGSDLGQVLAIRPPRRGPRITLSPDPDRLPFLGPTLEQVGRVGRAIGYRAVRSARPIKAWVCKNRRTIEQRASSGLGALTWEGEVGPSRVQDRLAGRLASR